MLVCVDACDSPEAGVRVLTSAQAVAEVKQIKAAGNMVSWKARISKGYLTGVAAPEHDAHDGQSASL